MEEERQGGRKKKRKKKEESIPYPQVPHVSAQPQFLTRIFMPHYFLSSKLS